MRAATPAVAVALRLLLLATVEAVGAAQGTSCADKPVDKVCSRRNQVSYVCSDGIPCRAQWQQSGIRFENLYVRHGTHSQCTWSSEKSIDEAQSRVRVRTPVLPCAAVCVALRGAWCRRTYVYVDRLGGTMPAAMHMSSGHLMCGTVHQAHAYAPAPDRHRVRVSSLARPS